MVVVYSFNKTGEEAACWEREISGASTSEYQVIPFNHGGYLEPRLYADAYKLDRLYQAKDERLFAMYAAFTKVVTNSRADAILVNNMPAYHPEFLRTLPVYRVLYSGDDPDSTYKRNIPYLHAYHHVMFLDPAYSPDLDMTEKMRSAGMVNADWLPASVYDFEFDPTKPQTAVLQEARDIDLIYIGHCFPQKLHLLTSVRRAFGRRFVMHGRYRLKHNLYLNVKHLYGGWVRKVSLQQRVSLYQRAKIGINIHWSNFGLGNQRLYHLPANGVMQLCDCAQHLDRIYKVGEEVVSYDGPADLIEKVRYYLAHDDERKAIAGAGYRRAMREYRFKTVMCNAVRLIENGMQRIGWKPGMHTPHYDLGMKGIMAC